MKTPDGDRKSFLEPDDQRPTRQECERDEDGRPRADPAADWLKRWKETDPWNPENQRKAP